MTASSFCSLSLDPPLVLVSIDRRARTHRYIAAQQAFGVHILADDQQEFSDRCAGRGGAHPERLDGITYRRAVTGAPILDHCRTWLDCSLWATYDGGDHTIYVGKVEAAGTEGERPLLWFKHHYRSLTDG